MVDTSKVEWSKGTFPMNRGRGCYPCAQTDPKHPDSLMVVERVCLCLLLRALCCIYLASERKQFFGTECYESMMCPGILHCRMNLY